MTQITVSVELARLIEEAAPPVVIVDPSGRKLGQLAPLESNSAGQAPISSEEWADIKKEMTEDDGTRYTWAEVKEYLRALAPE